MSSGLKRTSSVIGVSIRKLVLNFTQKRMSANGLTSRKH